MSRADFEKWEAKYGGGWRPADGPSAFLLDNAELLPTSGRALDVAGGVGRHAIWLAKRGLDVTLLDVSPTALDIAAERAEAAGVELSTRAVDLDEEGCPKGPWDLVLATFFRWNPLFTKLPELLAPSGLFVAEHPTIRNLERNEKPGRTYLLDEGEMAELVLGSGELERVVYEEGWNPRRRHTARIVARRAAA